MRFYKRTKTCLYASKAAAVFEINPITVVFCYCPEMKTYGTLNKHPGFQQHHKMINK